MNNNPLKSVHTFDIYYGSYDKDNQSKYLNSDLLILEPLHYDKSVIEDFKSKSETIFIGYQSIMEIPSWNDNFVSKMNDNDYLIIKGQKVYNENYNNYVGDIRKKSYRKLLISEIGDNIMGKGFDGVFFDTMDWIDYFHHDQELMNQLIEGYVSFLNELSNEYPGIIMIQNRSFRSLSYSVNEGIHGIVWENFSAENLDEDHISKILIAVNYQLKNNLKVFAISHKESKKDKRTAKLLRWGYLYSENTFSKWHEQ